MQRCQLRLGKRRKETLIGRVKGVLRDRRERITDVPCGKAVATGRANWWRQWLVWFRFIVVGLRGLLDRFLVGGVGLTPRPS
jgi:hypothetical protein